jgi:hypothetical protein
VVLDRGGELYFALLRILRNTCSQASPTVFAVLTVRAGSGPRERARFRIWR